MALLFNLRKSLLLKTNYINLCERGISTTPSLLWLSQRLSRSGSFNEKEKRFLEKDKVPQNYHLIYKAPMESYVKWAMHVSSVTASIVVTAACYQCVIKEPILDPIGTALSMQSEDIYFFSAGFLAINTVLRLVVSMYALRIYRDQEKYVAVYHHQLPLGSSHHHFEKGQVKPVKYLLSPWNNISYKLGDKTSLLLDDYFKTPSEFHEMQATDLKK